MKAIKNVLAVVVTYNRIICLRECLEALNRQTCKDFDILVVNNGSTDGTKEYLETQNDLIIVNQENLGGAGGFYAGMKYMYEHGYEWLWMMDDDGIPEENQLNELLKYGKCNNPVLNAMVLDKKDHSQLAFGVGKFASSYLDELTTKLFDPFNGTFINKIVIEKIGYIKKEMFIWGDEQEYLRRMKANGFIPKTVTSAIHFHPKEKGKRLYVFPFWKKFFILDKPRHLSKIYYRNLGDIDKNYDTDWSSIFRRILLHVIAFTWRFRWLEIYKFLRYYRNGMNNKFE